MELKEVTAGTAQNPTTQPARIRLDSVAQLDCGKGVSGIHTAATVRHFDRNVHKND
jgi:hypothetical protein